MQLKIFLEKKLNAKEKGKYQIKVKAENAVKPKHEIISNATGGEKLVETVWCLRMNGELKLSGNQSIEASVPAYTYINFHHESQWCSSFCIQ